MTESWQILPPKLPKSPPSRKAQKSGTPYRGSAATLACMYCGETFRSATEGDFGNYTTTSARKMLERHYVEKHAPGRG